MSAGSPRRRIALALVHHPVLDAEGRVVTTAVTNLDVHDLSRSARTYGCTDLFVTHPVDAQRELVTRIREHWLHGSSGKRIPDRKDAIELVRPVPALADAFTALAGAAGRSGVEVWTTAARSLGRSLTFAEGRARVAVGAADARPLLLVFGTGWGLAPEVVDGADALLEPIYPEIASGFNHLSVRAACAIALDRLLGPGRAT